MIIIESKRKKLATILKQYPGAIPADVTSAATDGLVKLSPFYPHGGIPVPFSEGYTATCVEAIWQGLKVAKDIIEELKKWKKADQKKLSQLYLIFGFGLWLLWLAIEWLVLHSFVDRMIVYPFMLLYWLVWWRNNKEEDNN